MAFPSNAAVEEHNRRIAQQAVDSGDIDRHLTRVAAFNDMNARAREHAQQAREREAEADRNRTRRQPMFPHEVIPSARSVAEEGRALVLLSEIVADAENMYKRFSASQDYYQPAQATADNNPDLVPYDKMMKEAKTMYDSASTFDARQKLSHGSPLTAFLCQNARLHLDCVREELMQLRSSVIKGERSSEPLGYIQTAKPSQPIAQYLRKINQYGDVSEELFNYRLCLLILGKARMCIRGEYTKDNDFFREWPLQLRASLPSDSACRRRIADFSVRVRKARKMLEPTQTEGRMLYSNMTESIAQTFPSRDEYAQRSRVERSHPKTFQSHDELVRAINEETERRLQQDAPTVELLRIAGLFDDVHRNVGYTFPDIAATIKHLQENNPPERYWFQQERNKMDLLTRFEKVFVEARDVRHAYDILCAYKQKLDDHLTKAKELASSIAVEAETMRSTWVRMRDLIQRFCVLKKFRKLVDEFQNDSYAQRETTVFDSLEFRDSIMSTATDINLPECVAGLVCGFLEPSVDAWINNNSSPVANGDYTAEEIDGLMSEISPSSEKTRK